MKEVIIIFLILIIPPLVTLGIYIFTRKHRKKAHYKKEELKWRSHAPSDMDFIRYSVFLIGDSGSPSLKHTDDTLELLRSKLLGTKNPSGIIFLGDNIYPKGMPSPYSPKHEKAERRLLKQLKTLDGYNGNIWFISGNHDWNKGRRGGYESLMRQQEYIDSYFKNKEIFIPRNGCPGPINIDVNKDLTIIFINTQWWVHSGTRPLGKGYGCKVDSEHEFFTELDSMLKKNLNKRVLIIGHHPLYSASHHGGHFSLKQHFFPLTSIQKNLYIPLPLAGSAYPMYRKYFGSKEDMSHPKYKNMRKRMLEIFNHYDNLIFASGHDHNLQYIYKDSKHFLISGSGCKVSHVQKTDDSMFVHAHKGFMRLDFYYNKEVWLEIWEPDAKAQGVLIYRKQMIS